MKDNQSKLSKVCFISTNLNSPNGGSETFWSLAAAHMASCSNIAVSAVVTRWNDDPPHYNAMKQAGVNVVYYDRANATRKLPRYKALTNRLLPFKYQFKKTGSTLQDKLIGLKPDLVVVSKGDHREGLDIADLLIRKQIPYINLLHLVSEYSVVTDETISYVRRSFCMSKANCFVSLKNAELAEIHIGAKIPHTYIVRNPLRIPLKYIDYPETIERSLAIACPASLHSFHKGQDLLFRVLAQDKWKNRAIVLNLYGEGVGRKQLEGLADLLGLKKMKFCGFVSDVGKIWAANHACVLPSRMEGQSLALIEAMACGRVPVVTDVGGAGEVVEDNVNGFLARYPTCEHIDEALERAWQARDRWASIGRRAHDSIKEYLTPDPVQSFAEMIEALL